MAIRIDGPDNQPGENPSSMSHSVGNAAHNASRETTSISTRSTGTLRERGYERMSVGELERRLSSMFPPEDAEVWDRTGLLVGDPTVQVESVVCALDPTFEALRACKEVGATVLLTHHPAFLDPLENVVAGSRTYESALVFEAIHSGIALMNYHTTLDVSPVARETLPAMLGLSCVRPLEPTSADGLKGFGHVCLVDPSERMTLDSLARRCLAVFGRVPRVWGAADTRLESVCTWTGSAGDAPYMCLDQGIDALVCGEVKYHAALKTSERGLCIIELGHDVSELPLATKLAEACIASGLEPSRVNLLDQNGNWSYPESRRA